MEFHVFLAVLFAAVLHATWNAVIRRGNDRFQGMLLLTVTQGFMGLAMALFVPMPSGIVWVWVIGSGALHTAYKLFLAAAYQHGDLSRVYPVARGAAPMMVVLVGFFLLPDSVQIKEYLGIGLIGVGVMMMANGAFKDGEVRSFIPLALGSAACTAGYSIVDGMGARVAGHATMFTAWLFVFDAVFFAIFTGATRGRLAFVASRKAWSIGAAAGALSLMTYWIAVWAMTVAPIALVAAVRETSVLFAVLIGVVVLKEKTSAGKFIAASVIVVGIVIIRL
ncbi:peptide ABC transporter permease [Rhodobacterales bacterium 52_120_T64]|nr:peptide ABC transporter permease [Rhodobacterales bacterium 52_120_T64]